MMKEELILFIVIGLITYIAGEFLIIKAGQKKVDRWSFKTFLFLNIPMVFTSVLISTLFYLLDQLNLIKPIGLGIMILGGFLSMKLLLYKLFLEGD